VRERFDANEAGKGIRRCPIEEALITWDSVFIDSAKARIVGQQKEWRFVSADFELFPLPTIKQRI
jgi:hypothetical protein